MKKMMLKLGLGAVLVGGLSGCGSASGAPDGHSEMSECMPHVDRAVAVAYSTEGFDVRGVVSFTETDEGVRVIADAYNLTPGEHGFHIHEFGDLRSADGISAGGHFNPTHADHGGPTAHERHVGDLGNLVADESGHAHLDWTDSMIKLNGPHSVIGRSVVIHERRDDLHSQPTGDAGPRAAVGVIGIAKE